MSHRTAVLVGVMLRLLLFITDDSLWRDEAKLLMGLYTASVKDLFVELPYGQRSPFALALLWQGMMHAHLAGSYWMRLPSLAAGIGQLSVYTFIFRNLFNEKNNLSSLIIWLAAVSPTLILFSTQIKPYIFDVFWSTVLIAVALPFFLNKKQEMKHSILLVLISWTSLFVSYPAAFTVGAICIGLLYNFRFKRLRLFLTISLGSSIIMIFVLVASGESSSYLQNFWIESYPTASLSWGLNALEQSVFIGLSSPNNLDNKRLLLLFGWLFLPLIALGIISLWRKQKKGLLCLLLLPSMLCLSASILRKYPYGDRLILFLVPHFFLLLFFGITHIFSHPRLKQVFQWGLCIAITTCCIVSIIEYSYPCRGIRYGLDYIASREKRGDVIVVDEYASQVVRYYQMLADIDNHIPFPRSRITFEWQDETTSEVKPSPAEIVDLLPSGSRVWIIAEPKYYHRIITSITSDSINKMIYLLMKSRKKIYHLQVPRLLVVGFSEELHQADTEEFAGQELVGQIENGIMNSRIVSFSMWLIILCAGVVLSHYYPAMLSIKNI